MLECQALGKTPARHAILRRPEPQAKPLAVPLKAMEHNRQQSIADSAVMQGSAQRAEIITNIKSRVCANVATRLTDQEAVQLSIAAAMREPEDVIGFLLPSHLAKVAVQKMDTFKILPAEWMGLFGFGTQPIRDGGLGTIVSSKEFVPIHARLMTALRTTIGEKEQAALWERAWCKVSCYIAIHLDCPDDHLVGTLGTIIKADNRRIEEMHSTIDDDGPEVMLIAQCVVALSKCLL